MSVPSLYQCCQCRVDRARRASIPKWYRKAPPPAQRRWIFSHTARPTSATRARIAKSLVTPALVGASILAGGTSYAFYVYGGWPAWLPEPVRLDSADNTKGWSRAPTVIAEGDCRRAVDLKKEALRAKEDDIARAEARLASQKGGRDGQVQRNHDISSHNELVEAGDPTMAENGKSVQQMILEYIVPEWAKPIPGFVEKLQREVEKAPGSLADEIWEEAKDPDLNPEIMWRASVRISDELCDEEKAFRERRKQRTTIALARYLGLEEEEVNPDDVPTIAICGSGGGLRALVAGAGSYLAAQQAGLYDCVMYTAGVSGSCWLQTLYYSSLGGRRFDKLTEHLKSRIHTHIAFPPTALQLLVSAPTNKFCLSGILEKFKNDPEASFGLVDIYGTLLAARLLVPKGDLGVEYRDLKLSNQQDYIGQGQNPLPIYTAVRHEIPIIEKQTDQETAKGTVSESTKTAAVREAWFQWFEFTPYEIWCEEFSAGIPTWSLGRKFADGRNVVDGDGLSMPELRMPTLLGIWASAFTATLSHYYKEVRPIVKGVLGFQGLDQLVGERNDDLIKVHPIDPAKIPNPYLGLRSQLPETCPESLHNDSHLQLMDSGMSCNLPLYPLLRPGRDVDILIAFDASADIKKENWLSRADGYARQRNLRGWPIGAGWPQGSSTVDTIGRELEAAQATSPQEAAEKIARAREQARQKLAADTSADKPEEELGPCTVWVGTTEERKSEGEPPQSKHVEEDWELMAPNAGITVIYFPLLPHQDVEGVDPDKSEFMSTWNFVYTPENVDQVTKLARANFKEGEERTKRAVRAVYERKKTIRQAREEQEEKERWERALLWRGGDEG